MRRLMRALLVLAVPAMLVTGVSAATAAPEAPASAALASCNSFTNVYLDGRYSLHVPSTSRGSGNFNCEVTRGDNNVAVLALQESLNTCYQQGIAEDRDFGANTERAVRNAQNKINQAHGPDVLTVDGRFGPKTSSYFRFQLYDEWYGGAHTDACAYR